MRLGNAWITVDPRNWKTRDDMTINVGLGTGGKAQQFAQVTALANVQKELISCGKANMVGDRELYNTAVELTRIMGHKNPSRFFNDPTAVNPQTGQLLYPPPAPPSPAPDHGCWHCRPRRRPMRSIKSSRPKPRSSWPRSRPSSTPRSRCSMHI